MGDLFLLLRGGELRCIPFDHNRHIDRDDQLRDGHGEPDGRCRGDGGREQDQNAADDRAFGDGDHKGSTGLHDCLEIVGGEDVQRQQIGNAVATDDARRDFQNAVGGGHKDPDEQIGDRQINALPEQTEDESGGDGIFQNLPDLIPLMGAVVHGDDGL